jgi:hypothetical protein
MADPDNTNKKRHREINRHAVFINKHDSYGNLKRILGVRADAYNE